MREAFYGTLLLSLLVLAACGGKQAKTYTYTIKGKITVQDNCGAPADELNPGKVKDEVEITYELLRADKKNESKTAKVKLNKKLEADYSISIDSDVKLDKTSKWSVPTVKIGCPKNRCTLDSVPDCGQLLMGTLSQIAIENEVTTANLKYECKCLP
mgnify:CR=1 FL=1